jgi:WD repeat-containing protein 25
LGHTKAVRNAIWSLNGTDIASISYDNTCLLSNVETGDEVSRQRLNETPSAIASHPYNPNIYLIGSKNIIYSWDSRVNKTTKQYKLQMGQMQDLLFINEKEFISSGDVVAKESAHLALVVWDFESQVSLSNQIYFEKYVCTCLKRHPLNNLFYAQTHGNYIAEFSTRNPYKMNKSRRFEGHQAAGYNIGFDLNKNGNVIASGSIDGLVYFYNTHSGNLMYKVDAFKNGINQPCMDAKFNPNNDNTVAVSSWDGKIKLFDKF